MPAHLQRPIECTTPRTPIESLQEWSLPSSQPLPGWVATRIQPTTMSTGRNASANVLGEA